MLTAGLLEADSAARAVADHCLLDHRVSLQPVGDSDVLLAARLGAGDDRALSEAFDRLGPAVYAGALRVLGDAAAAQDVVQDVFVELWSHPGRYDPAAGPLRAYLILLARHRAVDVVRSELRRVARQEHSYRLVPRQPGSARRSTRRWCRRRPPPCGQPSSGCPTASGGWSSSPTSAG